MGISKEQIDNIRKALDTLPDRSSEKSYEYFNVYEALTIEVYDFPVNPYKNIVNAACSTWGSAKIGCDEGSCRKWDKLSPQNRFIVALSSLKGETLPLALENVKFQFGVNGCPRHTFDQHARVRLAAHQSIGCRDNSKLEAPLVLYPELYKEIQEKLELKEKFESWLKVTKDLYETILSSGCGSFQTARAVLPMSYNHSFTTSIDLLSLKGQMSRRLMACEEAPIVFMYWKLREQIKKSMPLIANYLRPACDGAKKCIYHGGAEGLTKYFSNLFKGCGRWPDEVEYAEFNRSCSDYNELSKYVEIVPRDGWLNFTENDYEKLDLKDKLLFEQE
jgi:thymidylate synthase ThyX